MPKDQSNNSKPQGNENKPNEKPNPNIKPPEYMIITEGFDPSEVNKIIKKMKKAEKKS